MTGPKMGIGFWLLAMSGVILLVWHAWYYYPFIADDSFISFRYGERLLQGRGLTWNQGKPVEGYSNLLWILLLALAEILTRWPWWMLALLISLVCSVSALLITLKLVHRLSNGSLPATGCTMLLFVVSPCVAIWINGGLEAPLAMLLLISGISRLLKAGVRRRDLVLSGLFLGLLCLTRPDGIVPAFAAVLGYGFFFGHRKQALLPAAIIFSCCLAQLLFRLWYYGEWVPNTALAKLGLSWRRCREGFHYATGFLFPYTPFLLLVLPGLRSMPAGKSNALYFLSSIVLAGVVYFCFIGGDFFPGFRFAVPLVPLMVIIAGLSLQEAAQKWNVHKSPVLLSAVVTGGALLMLWFQARQPENKKARQDDAAWHYMAIGNTLRATFPPDFKLATGAAGVIPFSSRLPALDMLGLNDTWLSHHKPAGFGSGRLAHELGDVGYYLREKPDIVVFTGYRYSEPWLPQEKALFASAEFKSDYRPVNLVCLLDQPLPFPVYGFPDSVVIRIHDTVTLYLRRREPGVNH